ncbi:hypothetical protein SLE2022_172480 [Rubroshorea leprosula]
MGEDRSWMYRRRDEMGYWNNEFNAGVEIFLDFAFSQTDPMFCAMNMIRCPCSKCWNREWHHRRRVQSHLITNGFMDGYLIWKRHGEIIHRKRRCTQVGESSSAAATAAMNNVPSVDQLRDMLHDAIGPNFFNNENSATRVEDATQFDASFDDPSGVSTESIFEEPRRDAKEFFDLLRAADTPLFDGCDDGVTVLKWVCELMSAKTLFNMSVTNWDYVLKCSLMAFKKVDREKLPTDYYSAKKMLRRLGLGYKKYDVCVNNCILYYGEYESQCYLQCPVCEEPRFKQRDVHSAKPIPRKSLWYLPIIPRLQRLYMSRKTAEHMTWHLNCYNENEKMFHPACGEAWKHFDSTHPEFASEPRNVRLGLCTDGFTPFGHSASPYSCWPVFVSVYNLPPTICMKQEYVFLSLIIQGPQSPGKNIDVMLRPLIDDLKQLWYSRIQTYDSFRHQYFLMRAALMWTISDLPGYGMLSGWSTHGKLTCPYCMENSKAFWLEHGRKTSFFDCHRQFLPLNHPFRRNKNDFIKGRTENGTMPERLSGDEMRSRIHWLPDVLFGKPPQKQEIHGFGEVHNWVKKSIFWELPYWHTNLIRHNLDVMHCEKNFFDNILHTVMDDPMTKDNINARLDLELYCKRKSLHIPKTGVNSGKKPKATYVLSRDQRKSICQWLKQLKFPDGFASNISRCVNTQEVRLFGMKSHDYHIFMQSLIPIAFRDLLPKQVWEPLVEISEFFRALCAPMIQVNDMAIWHERIVEIICKLERIFPPSFFDSMEHLAIHLPYEARVGGPVQFRWMYPFERLMHCLKLTVKNKQHPEASICESYIMSEITNFISYYLDDGVHSTIDNPMRNIVVGFGDNSGLSIFKCVGKRIGSKITRRCLTVEERKAASYYVLMNCEELRGWVSLFESEQCQNMNSQQIQAKRERDLVPWFEQAVISDEFINVHEHIKGLSSGPKNYVSCYNGYIVNGFRFHTAHYGRNKRTMNYGVCVVGSIGTESDYDFYGVLQEIIQIEYYGSIHRQTVVLFKCDWYEIPPAQGVQVDQQHRLVDINPRRYLRSYEPFILASQARQVYYTPYPSINHERRGWIAALKIKARSIIEAPENKDDQQEGLAPYFQDDEPPIPQQINIDDIAYEPVQYFDGRFIEIHEEVDVEEGIGGEDEEGEWEDFETSEEENIETYVEENDSSDE